MDKRVIQISIDIIINENESYDRQMEEDIVNALENQGYAVASIGFVNDMTEDYKDYLEE